MKYGENEVYSPKYPYFTLESEMKYGENEAYSPKYPYFTLESEMKYGENEAYGQKYPYARTGPLFLLVIGVPSCIWANIPSIKRYRKNNKIS